MVQQIGRSIAYSFWPQSPCSRWSVCKATLTLKKKLVLCCSQPHHLDNQDFHKKRKRKVKSNAPKLRLTSFEPADQFTCWFLFFKNLTLLQVGIKESFKVFDNSRSTELDSLGPRHYHSEFFTIGRLIELKNMQMMFFFSESTSCHQLRKSRSMKLGTHEIVWMNDETGAHTRQAPLEGSSGRVSPHECVSAIFPPIIRPPRDTWIFPFIFI